MSIIIPVWNEEKNLAKSLDYLIENTLNSEIIVVDGGSSDQTLKISQSYKQIKTVQAPSKGRAEQMNYGSQMAKGEVLYFLHADAIPPKNFEQLILTAIEKGNQIGCFRFKFDSNKLMLRINSFFTRFNVMWCRGGDQSLFVLKSLFDEMKGYDEHFAVMEEYDFIIRCKEKTNFHILPFTVKVSARKYETNSWFKVMYANLVAFRMFKKGQPTHAIKARYQALLNPYL